MGVKMYLRIISKNHAADPEINFAIYFSLNIHHSEFKPERFLLEDFSSFYLTVSYKEKC